MKKSKASGKGHSIKEYPYSERPYEKLDYYGAEFLTDAELLAVIIRTGTQEKTSVDVAREILTLENGSLDNIKTLSLEELRLVKGVGRIKAIQLKAVAEIARRLSSTVCKTAKSVIRSSEDIVGILMPTMQEYCKEVVKIVFLNTKNCIIRITDISIGSLSASIVHPREIFREAVKCSAAAIIVCHNHPSGDPTPSREDLETTKRLVQAGMLIGIQVLDHLIFGCGCCESVMKRLAADQTQNEAKQKSR